MSQSFFVVSLTNNLTHTHTHTQIIVIIFWKHQFTHQTSRPRPMSRPSRIIWHLESDQGLIRKYYTKFESKSLRENPSGCGQSQACQWEWYSNSIPITQLPTPPTPIVPDSQLLTLSTLSRSADQFDHVSCLKSECITGERHRHWDYVSADSVSWARPRHRQPLPVKNCDGPSGFVGASDQRWGSPLCLGLMVEGHDLDSLEKLWSLKDFTE